MEKRQVMQDEPIMRKHTRLFTLLWAAKHAGALVELCPEQDYWHFSVIDASKLGHLRRLIAEDGRLYIHW